MSNPPTSRIGTITSMPARMPNRSLTQPIVGSSARPGIAHHAATEKPSERARAGIASDRVENSPGSSTARVEVNNTLATTANTIVGASANAAANTAHAIAMPRRNRKISAGSRRNSRVPSRAPIARPMNWNGSATAARYPRCSSSRLKTSS